MKKRLIFLVLTALLYPTLVYAKSNFETIGTFYFMSFFITIHMTFAVIQPLSLAFKQNQKKAFWIMFLGRIIFLLIAIPIFPYISIIDFFMVFIGAIIIVPISKILTRANVNSSSVQIETLPNIKLDDAIKTAAKNQTNQNNQVNAQWNANTMKEATIDKKYLESETNFLKIIIKEELAKNQVESNIITSTMKTKKIIIAIIYSIINFIAISFTFLHFPLIWFILIEIIALIIIIKVIKNYNIINYIQKEIKLRPDEKISNIVTNIVNNSVPNNKITNILIVISSFLIATGCFYNPHIFYEYNQEEAGYYVRFYTIGISNQTTVTIPKTYKNKPVVGIRGSVFANMKYATEINLPDSIKTIRGKAFLNDIKLTQINLPKKLTYLGGSAFKNCKNLQNIEIPEGVTTINGETFSNCTNLKSIKLHDNISSIHGESFKNCTSLSEITLPKTITEIRGNTFENCSSLREIEIPEGVTRIGGHAFHGCTSLQNVIFPKTILEIGSSAFRVCSSLYEVKIPSAAYINERAFKESPTKVIRIDENGNEINNNYYIERYSNYGDNYGY